MLENSHEQLSNDQARIEIESEVTLPVEPESVSIDTALITKQEASTISLKAALADIFKNSSKLVTCRVIYLAGTMVGFVILSSKDVEHLAASSLVNTTQTAITYMTTAVIYSVGIYAKGAFAEKRLKDIGEIYRHGNLMSLVITLPAAAATYFMGDILRATGQNENVIAILDEYNSTYVYSVPANMLFMNNLQTLLATNNYRMIGLQSTLYSGMFIPLSYAFMNGAWGFPELGAAGVGLASIFATWGSVLSIKAYFIIDRTYRREYQLCSTYMTLKTFLDLMKKGLPIGLQSGIETIYLTLLAQFLGRIGMQVLAASAPVWNVSGILTPVTFSLAHVAGVLTRKSVGEGDYKGAKTYGKAALLLGQVVPSLSLISFLTLTKELEALFMQKDDLANDDFYELARNMMIIYGAGLFPDALRNTAAGAMRGYNDTSFSMLSGFVDVLCIGTLLSGSLGFETQLAALGILAGRAIAFAIDAGVMGSYWWKFSSSIIDKASLTTFQSKSLSSKVSSWAGSFFSSNYLNNGNIKALPANTSINASQQSSAPTEVSKPKSNRWFSFWSLDANSETTPLLQEGQNKTKNWLNITPWLE